MCLLFLRKGTRLERLEQTEGEAWWEMWSQREWEARVNGLAGHITDCGFNSNWSEKLLGNFNGQVPGSDLYF